MAGIGRPGFFDEPGDGFSSSLHVQFVKDVREVILDGVVAQAKVRGDLLICLSIRKERHDEAFLRRQSGHSLRRCSQPRAGPNPVEGLLSDPRIKVSPAFCDRTNGPNEIIGSNVLQDIAMCSALDGRHNGGIFCITCQDEDADQWRDSQQSTAGLHSGGVREFHVEQHHLRVEALDERSGVCDRSGLTHDSYLRFEFEERTQSLPDKFMVIDDDHADLWLFHTGDRISSSENSAMMWVPWPTWERIFKCPPSLFARAAILASP